MRQRILTLPVAACFVFAISVGAQSSETNQSYETAIASLSENNEHSRVTNAIAVIESAGTKAFPALLAHLNDTTKASTLFQRAVMEFDETSKVTRVHAPTIGEACFDLIQGQVEGNWPKAYRHYYVLTPENVVTWWQSRKDRSLQELQIETARTSLARARQHRGQPQYSANAVRFLEAHLKEVSSVK